MLKLVVKECPDLIVIGGDIFDMPNIAIHNKDYGMKKDTFEVELARVTALIQSLLLETQAAIVLMRGNHDDRFFNNVMKLVPEEFHSLVSDPLELLVRNVGSERLTIWRDEFPLHEPIGTINHDDKLHYLMSLGDVIFSHCNFTGGEPGQAVLKLSRFIDEWHQVLGWNEPSVLVQFHVHQVSFQMKRGGWLFLIEPGMAGNPTAENYKLGYQAKWKPGTIGAVSLIQNYRDNEWKTARESVRLLLP
jgi:hypothetical protein